QRGLCLVLRRSGDSSLDCQVAQETLDFTRPKLARMTLAEMQDQAANPVDVSLFGADRVMLRANAGANLVEESRRASACSWRTGVVRIARRHGVFGGVVRVLRSRTSYEEWGSFASAERIRRLESAFG